MKKRKLNWVIGLIIVLFSFFYILPVLGPYLHPPLVTKYSEGFDKDTYNKIAIGVKRSVVDSLLGEPLMEWEDNSDEDSIKLSYQYSKNTFSILPYERIMILFYNNEVVNKICAVVGD